MRKNLTLALLFSALAASSAAFAKSSSPGHYGHGFSSRHAYKITGHNKIYSYGVRRDRDGHIRRSSLAKNQFKASHPCPATGSSSGPCPGYVVDHVIPLKRGGADAPSNMQWQTNQAAKAKDKWE